MSGKTTWAIKKAQAIKKQSGRHIIVFDPFLSPEWEADFITNDQTEFLEAVWKNKNCSVFVDESGSTVGKHNDLMNELATRGRHWGHKIFFICQRAKQISTTVRTQCSEIVIFKQALADTDDLAKEFVEPLINEAHKLEKGDFIYIRDGHEPVKANVFAL